MIRPTSEECIKLPKHLPQPEALRLIPEALARKHVTIPLAIRDDALLVAMANPSDIIAIEALATQCRMRIEPELASVEEIQEALDFNYQAYDEIEKQISNIPLESEEVDERIKADTVTNAPIAKALSLIIEEAIKARASDVHLQPQEDKLRVRYRIDGTLHDTLTLPTITATPLISRIKILASMNIADHHRPQDGQFSFKTTDKLIDIRVGTTPTVYGEMAALRLLDKSRAALELSELGFLPESLQKFEKMLHAPYGMILVGGPTGAGKTTTLYASINRLDHNTQNIITVEDPVEYRFKNINQVQVNPRAGLTFSSGLRSLLRLDPDVMLVGEVRDTETAKIAIQAALTGHLVLSSIHANDAIGIIYRLIDLGIEPFLISSALIGVIAQRMLRRVCTNCARLIDVPPAEQITYQKEIGEYKEQFLYGAGCKSCSNTGYQGRTGIFEVLSISNDLRAMVLSGAPAAELKNQAFKEGMMSLMKDGMHKVKAGVTTPAEVLRNAYSVE